jgi:hypothetical protein
MTKRKNITAVGNTTDGADALSRRFYKRNNLSSSSDYSNAMYTVLVLCPHFVTVLSPMERTILCW